MLKTAKNDHILLKEVCSYRCVVSSSSCCWKGFVLLSVYCHTVDTSFRIAALEKMAPSTSGTRYNNAGWPRCVTALAVKATPSPTTYAACTHRYIVLAHAMFGWSAQQPSQASNARRTKIRSRRGIYTLDAICCQAAAGQVQLNTTCSVVGCQHNRAGAGV